MQRVNICWFRRDLRLEDNAAMYHALKSGIPVLPIFIFDKNILDRLESREDRRVEFIYNAVADLHHALQDPGSALEVFHSTPLDAFRDLLQRFEVGEVFTNEDYEPYARERDAAVSGLLAESGVRFSSYKDQVIFEKDEIMKDDGRPYTVFTPYSKRWKASLNEFMLRSYPVTRYLTALLKRSADIPSLESIGFKPYGKPFPPATPNTDLIQEYSKTRDYPGMEGTSRLGIHLRFGTISIRELARKAMELNETFLNELIWREFYQMILWQFPQVGQGRAFKSEYDRIEWRNDESEFDRWCKGMTGYPLVDAGMRQLNETGFMHNRVRMVTASFLCKHLLIDWRWGEAYFAEKLLDYDLAANNGGWQWTAGSGCDAAPYFRIFNPALQAERFDNNHSYIKAWLPDLNDFGYPEPIVEHGFARKRCLEVYGKALKE